MNNSNPIQSRLTSFSQLFGEDPSDIRMVEIPIFQRDYAQGRRTVKIKHIRERFVDCVCGALLPDGKPIELDFVYGDVTENGTLIPLDGQQRL